MARWCEIGLTRYSVTKCGVSKSGMACQWDYIDFCLTDQVNGAMVGGFADGEAHLQSVKTRWQEEVSCFWLINVEVQPSVTLCAKNLCVQCIQWITTLKLAPAKRPQWSLVWKVSTQISGKMLSALVRDRIRVFVSLPWKLLNYQLNRYMDADPNVEIQLQLICCQPYSHVRHSSCKTGTTSNPIGMNIVVKRWKSWLEWVGIFPVTFTVP